MSPRRQDRLEAAHAAATAEPSPEWSCAEDGCGAAGTDPDPHRAFYRHWMDRHFVAPTPPTSRPAAGDGPTVTP